ncbi:MAG: hypothetical protein MZU97_02475 [Bacillus subtilis]|nr:hypothetical protein [Bacillus subtilis]
MDKVLLEKMGLNPTSDELYLHQAICPMREPPMPVDIDFAHKSQVWLNKLYEANLKSKTYPEKAFEELLKELARM